jgi:YVTN family beta-propeller protein
MQIPAMNYRSTPLVIAALLVASLIAFTPGCRNSVDSSVVTPVRQGVDHAFAINADHSVTVGWLLVEPMPVLFDADGPGTLEGIEVHRGSDHDFEATRATLLATLPPDDSRFTDTALVNGMLYYYRILPVGRFPNGIRRFGTPSDVVVGRPYDYSTVTTIDYAEHIQPIFTSGCAVSGCHVGSAVAHVEPAVAKAAHSGAEQFSLRSWEDLMAGGPHGAVVVPFRASKSHLIFHVNTDTLLTPVSTPHMPLPGFNLGVDQVQTLIRWVNEGAYNETGAIALSTYPMGKVLVTNQAEDLVCQIDVATGLVARYVQAGAANVFTEPPHAPHNICVDKARGVYYVNLVAAGKVLKYDLATNGLLGEVAGIASPTQVALSVTGDTGYVAQFAVGRNAIRRFHTQTMTLIDSIASLNFDKPHGVEVTPDGKELWITGNSTDNLLVVNLADESTELVQLNNQPPGSGFELLPYQTAMSSDNRFVYVSCQKSSEVRVVDRATKNVVAIIGVGQWPLIIAISPDDRFVYTANRNSNDVTVIRTSDNTVAATIANVGPQPHGIALTADGRYAYVACENVISLVPPHHPTTGSKRPGFVAVIDLATNTVVKQIEVGAFASGIAVVQ